MITSIAVIATILLAGVFAQYASAESIPDWIKNNAKWWAEGSISESDFVTGLQHLIKIDVLKVPPTAVSAETSDEIPAWVKNNAKWWAEGTISDNDFVNGVQHLMKIGIIKVADSDKVKDKVSDVKSVEKVASSSDAEITKLKAELDACQEIAKAYKRLDCEKEVKEKITLYEYKRDSNPMQVGPVTFYWPGMGTEGNSLQTSGGTPILTVRMLAENNGSNDYVVLMCTGPSICNYDVWNGDKAYKYSGMDFTNGQIVLKPGQARVFNMLFGPNIGYGGTEFEYDSTKDYYFRISEPWGSASIPLNLE